MKQSSKVYVGVIVTAGGLLLATLDGPALYATIPLGLVVFGAFEVLVGSVSSVSVGRKTLTVQHLLAAESVLGGLVLGSVTVTFTARLLTGTATTSDVLLGLPLLLLAAWMVYNGYLLLQGVTPDGYLAVEPNVERELQF